MPVVDTLLVNGTRAQIIAYASYLDGLNNNVGGCPLN